MSDSIEIREGFLCPFCMKDLGDIAQLETHVQLVHAAPTSSAGDKVTTLDIRGFLGKAKQRLLQIDVDGILPVVASDPFGGGAQTKRRGELHSPQERGVTRRHTDYFRSIRDQRVNQTAVDTNKLIIRLDKLINQSPTDATKRKEFEQDTVPWTDDSTVTHCNACNRKFNLATKRKHHCRLCGKIICHSCSKFLTFAIAKGNVCLLMRMSYEFECRSLLNECEAFITKTINKFTHQQLFELCKTLSHCDKKCQAMTLLVKHLAKLKRCELEVFNFEEVPGDIVAQVFELKLQYKRTTEKCALM